MSLRLRSARLPRARHLPIFLLHSLADSRSSMAVSPPRFAEQVDALSSAGLRCLALGEALQALRGRDVAPSYVLTFDDGYESVYDPGLELLTRYDLQAVLFVAVNFIERRVAPPWHSNNRALIREYRDNAAHFRPLEWGQLRELAASGRVEIGSHTMNHNLVGRLPLVEMREELRRSKEVLEDKLGVRVRFFSYPYGVRRYGAYSRATETAVREAGYECSVSAEIGRAACGREPYLLPRIPLEDVDRGVDARAKAAGGYDWVALAHRAFQTVFPNPHLGGR